MAPNASAQDAQNSVLTYPASFFADQRPNTAYDMIGRLPGFTFNDGTSARGFAGTAGNVLIDGERPTSKSDDLQSILQRIPAGDVDHIDIIRGGAQGIDMHGQTVIANVVRKKTDSTRIVAEFDDNFFPDGETVPYGSVQYTRHTRSSTYEASLSRTANFDDSVGNGFHDITDVATGTVARQQAHTSGRGAGASATGAATVPLWDGQFKANLALQDSPFFSTNSYTAPGNDQTIKDKSGSTSAELGLHWEGPLGGTHLEILGLQRLGHQSDVNSLLSAGDNEIFESHANTGESIVRATLRYLPIDSLTLEGGAEGAFNFLDGTSSFIDNGVIVAVPNANARVTEKRGEAFFQATWKANAQWMFELGARSEYSIIAETGDTDLTRHFFYPKPRAVVTWAPDGKTQVRFRYERVLGQLDFNNFVASSSLSASGINAGNANLQPDQHAQYELSLERDFWDKGAVVLTLMHENIKDVEDYVPVTGTGGAVFDAPGNIGNGRNDQIDLELTLPLDRLGLENGLLKATNIFRLSKVPDPVTGQNRIISGQRPQDIEWTLTQDLPALNSSWGIFFFNAWSEHYYRLEQVRSRRVIPPYFQVWWDYKPRPGWSLHFEITNPAPFVYDDRFYDYAGPRDTFPLQSIEELSIKSQPRLYVQIRKTFD
ncbi:MAG TPA: TonB-dependent receptor [Rhizomicrobium sp.]|nr:TonB-dependent receptor [Rhizomicrobium sp.]